MSLVPTLERPFPEYQRFLPDDFTPVGVMHVVDRVVGRQFLLGTDEKEYFRDLLRRIAAFTGLELLTWTCLDNHFHLLLKIPNATEAQHLRDALSEEDVLGRMKGAFSAEYIQEVKWRLTAFRRDKKPEMAESIIRRLKAQMFDLSAFMHMLKRRFSAWYNRQHGRKGTLWEGRFRSVLVEESREAVMRMATYIDLNAVRAGIVQDPAKYRWCGYAEALAGNKAAQSGIRAIVSTGSLTPEAETQTETQTETTCTWEESRDAYGSWLYEQGCEVRDESGKVIRKGISHEEVERIQAAGGRLSRTQLLHCRVRYFADGVAIGSRAFIEKVFERYRHRFGPKRKSGARPMRHGDWGGLCSLRDLKQEVIRGG